MTFQPKLFSFPWKPYKNVQKSKIECDHSNPHTIDYILSIYYQYTKFLYFLRYGAISTSMPHIF